MVVTTSFKRRAKITVGMYLLSDRIEAMRAYVSLEVAVCPAPTTNASSMIHMLYVRMPVASLPISS